MNQAVYLESYSSKDLALLSELQKDASQSTSDLAEKTGLSPNSVLKRRRAFKTDGVISSEVALLNPNKVGSFLYFMVDLKLSGLRVESIDATTVLAIDNPMIIQCFQTTGIWDFKLLIVARTSSEFEQFTRDNFLDNDGVERFESNLVTRPIKVGFSLPLL